MALERVGGKSDGGVDLIGWWWLPMSSANQSTTPSVELPRKRFRVIGQCKAERKKLGPNYVREMEGVLHRHLLERSTTENRLPTLGSTTTQAQLSSHATGQEDHGDVSPIVALVVSESSFSKATLLRAHSSPVPFFLLHLPPTPLPSPDTLTPCSETGLTHIGSAFWNSALGGASGLLRGEVELRWERQDDGAGRPGLWTSGRRIESWTPDIAHEYDV
jgi:hypothetical protein